MNEIHHLWRITNFAAIHFAHTRLRSEKKRVSFFFGPGPQNYVYGKSQVGLSKTRETKRTWQCFSYRKRAHWSSVTSEGGGGTLMVSLERACFHILSEAGELSERIS